MLGADPISGVMDEIARSDVAGFPEARLTRKAGLLFVGKP
jgi:hypothetical protein